MPPVWFSALLYYGWPLLCAIALISVGRRYARRSEHAADQAEDACHRAFDAADEAEAHATRCAAEPGPGDTTELPPVKDRTRSPIRRLPTARSSGRHRLADDDEEWTTWPTRSPSISDPAARGTGPPKSQRLRTTACG
jgi:type II secretory pathway pseudopilin PulG